MRSITGRAVIILAAALPVVAACDARDATGPEPFDSPAFAHILAPDLPAPADFVDPAADPNPWFPLIPHTVRTYEADTDDGLETTIVTVTDQTKTITIDGGTIQATVVLDEVYLEGVLIERTFDWFGQDRWGNVWYLGEDSCEYEEPGGACDPAGSWEHGVDGAEAGIIMWANPLAYRGRTYRQEFYEGEAEDMAKVLRGGLTVTVPADTFSPCIETMDWTPLEPGEREFKIYCLGFGLVLEVQPMGGRVRNELVSISP